MIIGVDRVFQNCVSCSLRVDFDGKSLAYGRDETYQFVTDLFESPDAVVVREGTPTELAEIAADWLEQNFAIWSEEERRDVYRIPSPTPAAKRWWRFWG